MTNKPQPECPTCETLRQKIVTLEDTIEQQAAQIKHLEENIEQLKRAIFGQKRERVAPAKEKPKEKKPTKPSKEKQEQAQRKREEKRRQRDLLPIKEITIEIEEKALDCPSCGGSDYIELPPEVSDEFEYVPAHLIRRRYMREKKACHCKEHVVVAEAPARVVEGGLYGPGLYAQTIVQKCSDAMPLHRQVKALQRAGLGVARSTLCDLFHRAADLLRPLYQRMVELVALSGYVNADETRISVQEKEKTRTAWMWTFIAQQVMVFVYSASRSGETPEKVLQDSTGYLQVDAYSGYNRVTVPERRERVGCWAHARRKFYDALSSSPQAQVAIDLIRKLYEVEYEAARRKILGTGEHWAMRKLYSQDILDKIYVWLEEEKEKALPRGPLGKALGYLENNWKELCGAHIQVGGGMLALS